MDIKAGSVILHNFSGGPELVLVVSWDGYSKTHYTGIELEYDGDDNAISILPKHLAGPLIASSVMDLCLACSHPVYMRTVEARFAAIK